MHDIILRLLRDYFNAFSRGKISNTFNYMKYHSKKKRVRS